MLYHPAYELPALSVFLILECHIRQAYSSVINNVCATRRHFLQFMIQVSTCKLSGETVDVARRGNGTVDRVVYGQLDAAVIILSDEHDSVVGYQLSLGKDAIIAVEVDVAACGRHGHEMIGSDNHSVSPLC